MWKLFELMVKFVVIALVVMLVLVWVVAAALVWAVEALIARRRGQRVRAFSVPRGLGHPTGGRTAVAAVVLIGVLAAVGGSSGGSSASTPSLAQVGATPASASASASPPASSEGSRYTTASTHQRRHRHRRRAQHHTKASQVASTTPHAVCDPNYKGACLDPNASDYDCAGGSGNGPKYVEGPVEVVGTDHYGLDADGDGIGCQS